jgi:hypothetical protein
MFRRLRPRLTYANVVSTLCLFILLGGGAYASTQISGSNLKNRSVSGVKVKKNALGGTEINESKLGKVPAAGNADKLNGSGAPAFVHNGQTAGGSLGGAYPSPTLACPADTTFQSGFCFDNSFRAAGSWYEAADACAAAGRRIPSVSEAWDIAKRVHEGGWTSTAYHLDTGGGTFTNEATFVMGSGAAGSDGPYFTAVSPFASRSYRCVINAGNR